VYSWIPIWNRSSAAGRFDGSKNAAGDATAAPRICRLENVSMEK